VRFDLDVLAPNAELPSDLRRAILGARAQIVFVEGTPASLDSRLYQLLFPDVTVTAKGGCLDVIRATEGLRSAEGLHWIEAFGLIDRDNRPAAEIAELQHRGVFALGVCSIESLFFGRLARTAMAELQGRMFKRNPSELSAAAEAAALAALDDPGAAARLSALRCERDLRESMLARLPKAAELAEGSSAAFSVDPSTVMKTEQAQFSRLRQKNNLDGLIARYQLRKTRCFNAIATELLFADAGLYEDAVVAHVEHNDGFRESMLALLEPLASCVSRT
jgi:hypothetical protein